MTLFENNEEEVQYEINTVKKLIQEDQTGKREVIESLLVYIDALMLEAEEIINKVNIKEDMNFYKICHADYMEKLSDMKDEVLDNSDILE